MRIMRKDTEGFILLRYRLVEDVQFSSVDVDASHLSLDPFLCIPLRVFLWSFETGWNSRERFEELSSRFNRVTDTENDSSPLSVRII